jgi:hypothetical protein
MFTRFIREKLLLQYIFGSRLGLSLFLECCKFSGWQKHLFFSFLSLFAYAGNSWFAYTTRFCYQVLAFRQIQCVSFFCSDTYRGAQKKYIHIVVDVIYGHFQIWAEIYEKCTVSSEIFSQKTALVTRISEPPYWMSGQSKKMTVKLLSLEERKSILKWYRKFESVEKYSESGGVNLQRNLQHD